MLSNLLTLILYRTNIRVGVILITPCSNEKRMELLTIIYFWKRYKILSSIKPYLAERAK